MHLTTLQTPVSETVSPRKRTPKKDHSRHPAKRHKPAPPPFFDITSVYSDLLFDEHLFDSDDEEEYVPGDEDDEDEDVEEEGEGEGEDSSDGEEGESDEDYDIVDSEDSDEETVNQPSISVPINDLHSTVQEYTNTTLISTPMPIPMPDLALPSIPAPTPTIDPPPPTPVSITSTSTLTNAIHDIHINGEPENIPDSSEIGNEIDEQQTGESDIDDVISKRTRAHHSLVNVELEELEKYLQISPCGSPMGFDVDDWSTEPRRAVEYQSFLASLQTDDIDPILLDDETDADFDYVAELSQAKDTEEQDEYRNDRAVQVSKKEIDELMKGQELEMAASETLSYQTKRRRKTRSATKSDQMRAGPLKAIRPFAEAPRISHAFTQQQLHQLQKQISDHAQLLLQVYLQARRETQPEPAQQCWEMMTELASLREAGMAANPMLFTSNSPEVLQARFETVKPSQVLFYTHVVDQMDNLQQLVETDTTPTVKTSEIILQVFSETFNQELKHVPASQSSGSRLRFTPAEDALLARGLEKHGISNWVEIVNDLLPTKTPANLANRFKNMTARRACDNPIKAYKSSRPVPLTPHEEIILQQGLRTYGENWDAISRNLLPSRAGPVLQKAHEEIQKKRASEKSMLSFNRPPGLVAPLGSTAPLPIPPLPLAPVPIAPLPYKHNLQPILPAISQSAHTLTAPASINNTLGNTSGFRHIRVNLTNNGKRSSRSANASAPRPIYIAPKPQTSYTNNIAAKPNSDNFNNPAFNSPVNSVPLPANPPPMNEVSIQSYGMIFLLSGQDQIVNNPLPVHSTDIEVPTYTYYPPATESDTPEVTVGYGGYSYDQNETVDLRASNSSEEFEFEELDSDGDEFEQPLINNPVTPTKDLPPTTPQASQPPPSPAFPFLFTSPSKSPFSSHTSPPSTPNVATTATPQTPTLNIFSLDILSTSPATPGTTPTKSAAATPTKSNTPNSPNANPPTHRTSPVHINLTPPKKSLFPTNSPSPAKEPVTSPIKYQTPTAPIIPTNIPIRTITPTPPNTTANMDTPPTYTPPTSHNVPTGHSPPNMPITPPTVPTPPTAYHPPSQAQNGHSPPTVPITPPTAPTTPPPSSSSEIIHQSNTVPSISISTNNTSINSSSGGNSTLNANNRMVLEDGLTLVWSKEEDRAILCAAKGKLPSESFEACWARQALDSHITKTPAQIEKRYTQLLQLMQLYNAKSGKVAT